MRKKIILDDYEKEIEESLSKGKINHAPDLESTKKLFSDAVKNYKELQETKSITLRIKKEDLLKIKAKANQNMIPYQTLIGLLIRRYVKGKTTVSL